MSIRADAEINGTIDINQSIEGSLSDRTTVEGDIKHTLLKGLSAYEIAVENGFVGTEEEWLDSLQGERGVGVPAGGTQGQVLTKNSAADDDTAWRDVNAVTDVTVNGVSLVNEETGIANIPIAGADKFGVIKVADSGEMKGMDGLTTRNQRLSIFPATIADVKNMSSTSLAAGSRPIVPVRLNAATFYGLARAAGDSTQLQSANAIGNYTDEAKSAIQTMLGLNNKIEAPATAGTSGQVLTSDGNGGQSWEDASNGTVTDVKVNGASVLTDGVANIPRAGKYNLGVVRVDNTSSGITLVNDALYTVPANASQIKSGYMTNVVLSPARQHESVFYGLAKAAGDSSQAESSNNVGAYTDEAKSAIKTMLGVPSMDDIIAAVHDSYTPAEEVSF